MLERAAACAGVSSDTAKALEATTASANFAPLVIFIYISSRVFKARRGESTYPTLMPLVVRFCLRCAKGSTQAAGSCREIWGLELTPPVDAKWQA